MFIWKDYHNKVHGYEMFKYNMVDNKFLYDHLKSNTNNIKYSNIKDRNVLVYNIRQRIITDYYVSKEYDESQFSIFFTGLGFNNKTHRAVILKFNKM